MKFAQIATGAIVGFVLAGLVFILVAPDLSKVPLIQALGSMGILLSASIVAFTYEQNSRKLEEERTWNQSRLVAEAALTSLERAYQILTLDGNARVPPNDRLTWLTCARNLLTAQELGRKITDPTHRLVFEEQLEYWRTKFYRYLEPLGDAGGPMDVNYFADDISHTMICSSGDRQPIAEKSLAVIFRFIRWPESREDRLHEVDAFTEEEISHLQVFGHAGVGAFIQQSREYRASRSANNQP